jgi:Ca2+-binding RTX toxin-like protein
MATAKIEAALGPLGDISDFIGNGKLNFQGFPSTTSLTLVDAQGDGFTLTGTGLTFDLTGVASGTFTGLRIFSATNATLMTVTDFSIEAQPFYQVYKAAGIAAGVLDLFKDADSIAGSSVADKLVGFAGNDIIKGGRGNDIIAGSLGRDKLYGQVGADVFLFTAGDGRDKIMDFTDFNTRTDDRIGLTQRMYNQMHVEESLTGVTLDFGRKGSIFVLNWHAADVDITDFLIG